MANDEQIQPLNDDPLANLSIEELEQRLEMSIVPTPDLCIGQCSTGACGIHV